MSLGIVFLHGINGLECLHSCRANIYSTEMTFFSLHEVFKVTIFCLLSCALLQSRLCQRAAHFFQLWHSPAFYGRSTSHTCSGVPNYDGTLPWNINRRNLCWNCADDLSCDKKSPWKQWNWYVWMRATVFAVHPAFTCSFPAFHPVPLPTCDTNLPWMSIMFAEAN